MYKAQRLTLEQTVKVIDGQAVTTTDSVISDIVDARGYGYRTVMVSSGLDKSVSATLQGSYDSAMAEVVSIGDAVAVTSSAPSGFARNDYYPYIRLLVTNADAPSTGTLSGWVMLKI